MHPSRRTIIFPILLTLLLPACKSGPSKSVDDTPAQVTCPSAPPAVVIEEGWRFHTDPGDSGLTQGWNRPDFDDSAWKTLAPGAAWEDRGVSYDGIAWYRVTIILPEWDAVYLTASRIDDAATVWVNGTDAAHWELPSTRAGLLNLRDFAASGESVTLVFQVDDRGGYGGLIDPVRLGPQPQSGLSPAQWVTWLADSHPGWPMPGWTAGRPLAWTITGGLDQADEALVSMDGAMSPWADAPIVEVWLVDSHTGQLISGSGSTAFSLANGNLPIPQWEWTASGITVRGTLFYDADYAAVRWLLTADASAATGSFKLLVAVRPFAVNQSANPIRSASLINPSRLWLDGRPFLIASQKPEASGVGPLADVMAAALAGQAPQANTLGCAPDGDGSALLVYSLQAGQSTRLHFAFPAVPGAAFPPVNKVNVDKQLEKTTALWQAQTGRVTMQLPDDRITAAVPASTGYLLLANDPDGPHPGSLAHNAVWVRDAAYTGLALLQTGHADTVKNYLTAIFAGQEASGRVPPIQGQAIPWTNDEWDSQGQAIFLTTSYYRYTGDLETLHRWYPNLRQAAAFLVELRQQTANDEGPTRGLLPPSLSAEDLGPADQHYYWDDFWAVTGLEEAAYAARVLGETSDAAWMTAEAASLRGAILDSVNSVMGDEPPYIPASVEESESSAMARGTVPALWPYAVFSPDLPLLQRSFDTYYRLWIEPYGGAYRHREGQYWPYGGLELAHAYLALGRGDVLHQILAWTLSHQTLPGTFAWAEQVDPATGGFSGGDMPHAWAAASMVTLIREMLASEQDGGTLQLFNMAPDWWFEAGRSVVVENLPTWFGSLQLRTASDIQTTEGAWHGTLTITLSVTPPGAESFTGFRWKVPGQPTSVEGASLQNGWLIIPPDGGTVKLMY